MYISKTYYFCIGNITRGIKFITFANMSYIIGICGGSASGKTYLLEKILARFSKEKCTLISLDNYYKPLEAQHKDEEGLINFDHPDSLDLDKFVADIKDLINGKTIHIKEYTFNNPESMARTFTYRPTPIIILEGLFVFHKPELNRLMNLKLFVDADEHIRFSRRLKRDVQERNYSFDETIRDYNKFVAPMYAQFVAPTQKQCDFIIPNNHNMETAIEVIISYLNTIVG